MGINWIFICGGIIIVILIMVLWDRGMNHQELRQGKKEKKGSSNYKASFERR